MQERARRKPCPDHSRPVEAIWRLCPCAQVRLTWVTILQDCVCGGGASADDHDHCESVRSAARLEPGHDPRAPGIKGGHGVTLLSGIEGAKDRLGRRALGASCCSMGARSRRPEGPAGSTGTAPEPRSAGRQCRQARKARGRRTQGSGTLARAARLTVAPMMDRISGRLRFEPRWTFGAVSSCLIRLRRRRASFRAP